MSQPLEATQHFWDDDDDDDDGEIEEATSSRLIRVEDGSDGEATPVPPPGTVLAIGRLSSEEHSCNLVLHDAEKRPPVVSSRHALLRDIGGVLQLHILSTSSFTFINEMAFIAKRGVELEPLSLHHGDILRFGGGKRQADKYEMFIYRVDAASFPQLSRQASLQPSPAPSSRSSSSPAPAVSRSNSGVVAPDSRPAAAAVPPVGPPMWRWQSDKAQDVWSPYCGAQCAVIERAWQRSEKQVRVRLRVRLGHGEDTCNPMDLACHPVLPVCHPMHPACNPVLPACNPMHPACNPVLPGQARRGAVARPHPHEAVPRRCPQPLAQSAPRPAAHRAASAARRRHSNPPQARP